MGLLTCCVSILYSATADNSLGTKIFIVHSTVSKYIVDSSKQLVEKLNNYFYKSNYVAM